jgi:hypothetical protein
MKKVYVVLLLLFLAACETRSTLDIRQELLSTIKAQSSFVVSERFEWQRFATIDEGPWNEFVEKENNIIFQNNRYFVEHLIDVETNNNRVIDRTLFQATSYKNIYSRNAAVLINRQWYNLDLPLINTMGLGTLDPITVVNELLYSNNEIYYKSDTGVTGDISSFRYAVVTISDDVFRRLFSHTVLPHVNIPYSYTVTAEIAFDDDYRILSIEFDFNRLIREYRDYYTVQQGATILSLTGSYKLIYNSYNNVVVPNLPSGNTLQPSDNSIADFEDLKDSSNWIETSFESVGENASISIRLLRPARLVLIEVQGLKNEQTTLLLQQQVVAASISDRIQFLTASELDVDFLLVSIRLVDQTSSRVILETIDVTSRFLNFKQD